MNANTKCWVWLHERWRPAIRLEQVYGTSLVRVLIIGMAPSRLVDPSDIRNTNPYADTEQEDTLTRQQDARQAQQRDRDMLAELAEDAQRKLREAEARERAAGDDRD
ncbi:hypothetical protein GCM10010174_69770 [Kutzneria viridogrisea]|uniref:Uncharacterized protein n=1 Tax=Kutzneria viridogrisea TaxID=47990 RepID=A0ABR6BB06_9PSEU|nr:hypothetical protein [Kutzneria viridogrisea]